MALITALKAAFLRARRGLAQVFAAFHASTRFLPVRLRLCACEYAHKTNGKRGKMFNLARVLKVGYCGYRGVVVLLCAYYRRNAEQYPSRVALWDKFLRSS